MKVLFGALIIVLAVVSTFSQTSDKTPNWNFYYKKTTLLQGSRANHAKAEVRVDSSDPGNILATFNYDIASPVQSKLEIMDGERHVKTVEFSREGSSSIAEPAIGTESHFVIPIQEIVDLKEKKTVNLDFYYSDDRGASDVKLATIAFSF